MATRQRMAKTPEELGALAQQREELVRRRSDIRSQHDPTINEFERALKKAKTRRDRLIAAVDAKISRLETVLAKSAHRLRGQLIPGTVKTADLPGGSRISFRNQPDRLIVDDQEAAVAWLEEQGLADFVVVEKRLNIEALELDQNRGTAEAVPGLHFEPEPERVYLTPPGGRAIHLKS